MTKRIMCSSGFALGMETSSSSGKLLLERERRNKLGTRKGKQRKVEKIQQDHGKKMDRLIYNDLQYQETE